MRAAQRSPKERGEGVGSLPGLISQATPVRFRPPLPRKMLRFSAEKPESRLLGRSRDSNPDRSNPDSGVGLNEH